MESGAVIAFWTLAITGVLSAFGVVLLKDVLRAALFLVVTFLSLAGLYVILQADFLAVVQVLIYAGAISILLIFAIMLTREMHTGSPSNRLRGPVFVLVFLLFLAIVFAILNTDWHLSGEQPLQATTNALAKAMFNDFVLPFEIASALLLAAIIGSIVIMKER